ncbi:RdgB/HAM1 family non-canonical purine NTP pyrophosphatase [Nocardioidaceae bacterium]|nr:RdgB/HAM1 family non-canonical purine NTP pyrophosphatase [Nocardioidaceae bacterium]
MTQAPTVFLASRNPGKVAEMQRILGEHLPGVEVRGLGDVEAYDEPVEDRETFAGNAVLKAATGLRATGLPTIADDSGLCVDALNGMPGVLSARWSGLPKDDDRNNRLLLDQLHDVPDARRTATFRCAVAVCLPWREEPLVVEGTMPGRVIRECRGESGFGYDVLFVPEAHDSEKGGDGRTSAQLTKPEKDAISHRGAALRELAPLVAAAFA